MSVDDPGKGAGVVQGHGADGKRQLLSVRTLLILAIAAFIGVLGGLAAGVPAGLAVDASAGWGLAVGLISGFAAATVTTALMAAGLHALIGSSD